MFRQLLSYISLTLLLAAIFSCSKELELPKINADNRIALIGELVVGDSIYMRAGQSLPLSSKTSLSFQILNGLSIKIEEPSGNTVVLNGYEDALTTTLNTVAYSAPVKVKEDVQYKVYAKHAELGDAYAFVTIPQAFSAKIRDTVATKYFGDSVLKVDIDITDIGNATHYYAIEALKQRLVTTELFLYNGQWLAKEKYKSLHDSLRKAGNLQERTDTTFLKDYERQFLYTGDVNTDNVKNNGALSLNKRVLLNDKYFNGSNYTITVYMQRSTIAYPDINSTGRILLYVKSVAEDYYKYLQAYEQYVPTAGYNTFTQPAKIEGNVQNGAGMIGGAYVNKFVIGIQP